MMAVWKIAPALAAGNTVVLKPSDTTPVSTLLLAEIAAEFLPPGVFNVVCGDRDTGRALVDAPDPAAGVDHRLDPRRHGGRRPRPPPDLKRAHLELGGKAPVIVFDDADIDGRGRGDRGRRLLQRRPGLHRRDPGARRPGRPRRLRRRADRAGPQHEDRRAGRRGRALRPAQQRQPARPGQRLRRPAARTTPTVETGGGRGSGDRGYFYAPTVVSGAAPGRRDHPGRDLRPGHHRAALRRRGRGGALGQRRASTAWPPSVWTRTTAGRCG